MRIAGFYRNAVRLKSDNETIQSEQTPVSTFEEKKKKEKEKKEFTRRTTMGVEWYGYKIVLLPLQSINRFRINSTLLIIRFWYRSVSRPKTNQRATLSLLVIYR